MYVERKRSQRRQHGRTCIIEAKRLSIISARSPNSGFKTRTPTAFDRKPQIPNVPSIIPAGVWGQREDWEGGGLVNITAVFNRHSNFYESGRLHLGQADGGKQLRRITLNARNSKVWCTCVFGPKAQSLRRVYKNSGVPARVCKAGEGHHDSDTSQDSVGAQQSQRFDGAHV